MVTGFVWEKVAGWSAFPRINELLISKQTYIFLNVEIRPGSIVLIATMLGPNPR